MHWLPFYVETFSKEHRLRVPRDRVLSCVSNFDPEGMAIQRVHRLKRRKYRAKGPNYGWLVNGFDKLKPYG